MSGAGDYRRLTGNHGQLVAYAAGLFVGGRDLRARAGQPGEGRVDAGSGRRGGLHGRDFDEAREHCEQQATRHGYRYGPPGTSPGAHRGRGHLHRGDPPGPAGHRGDRGPVGGSGAAGACVVAKAVRSSVEVIGAQSRSPGRLPLLASGHPRRGHHQHVRGRAGHRTAFAQPQAICGTSLMTSCWSPRTR